MLTYAYFLRAEAAQEQDAEKTTDETNEGGEEGEEEAFFQEVEKLQNLGINAGDIQKLKTGVWCSYNLLIWLTSSLHRGALP